MNIQGRTFLLTVSTNGGYNWRPVGGVQSKTLTRDNPVADVTSQSVSGGDTESAFNGFGNGAFEASGVVDDRDPTANFNFGDLETAAWNGETIAAKLSDGVTAYSCDWNITNIQKSTEQNGILQFSFSAQNARQIFRVPLWYDLFEELVNVTIPAEFGNIQYGTQF